MDTKRPQRDVGSGTNTCGLKLVLKNNAYMPYISSTLDDKRQTIIQDPLIHTSLLDNLNSLVVNDEDYSLKLDPNEYFLLYFY